MKHKVSGVPYDVELDKDKDEYYVDAVEYFLQKSDSIAELEHENNCLRARNERLETEVKTLEARVKVLEQECNWLESKTREVKHDGYVSGNH